MFIRVSPNRAYSTGFVSYLGGIDTESIETGQAGAGPGAEVLVNEKLVVYLSVKVTF